VIRRWVLLVSAAIAVVALTTGCGPDLQDVDERAFSTWRGLDDSAVLTVREDGTWQRISACGVDSGDWAYRGSGFFTLESSAQSVEPIETTLMVDDDDSITLEKLSQRAGSVRLHYERHDSAEPDVPPTVSETETVSVEAPATGLSGTGAEAYLQTLILRAAVFGFGVEDYAYTEDSVTYTVLYERPEGRATAMAAATEPWRLSVWAPAAIVHDPTTWSGEGRELMVISGGIFDARAVAAADSGEPYVAIQLDDFAAEEWAELTAEHINGQLLIVLDGEVLSAPVVRETVTDGTLTISFPQDVPLGGIKTGALSFESRDVDATTPSP